MSKTPQQLIEELIGREGGYVNNPNDRGGPTNWGITEQTARAFGYHGDMRDLKRESAISIYLERYWRQTNLYKIGAIYPTLAAELFDTAVNMGPKTAGEFLQRSLNVLNRGVTDYPNISVDGAIGNMTLAALSTYRAKRGATGELVMLRAVDGLQIAKYIAIAEANPSQETFVFGWLLNRTGV